MPLSQTVPDIACAYERYDPQTLKPENESTLTRLIETGWTESTFSGRSVLDIGCNSGALSLFAHSLGAKSVRAIDVTPEFIDFFTKVVADHNLPILVDRVSFNDLNSAQHGADVVLCMEVLHWIVHQGGTLPRAMAQLASLTNETLYVETPWDIHEPSIAHRKEFPTENYDIELIFRELARHFQTVSVERFMTYFGTMQNSKRVLIKATNKRTLSLPLQHIQDANHSGISLSRGVNESVLITTTHGPKVLKSLPTSSAFNRLNDSQVETICRFLVNAGKETVIVAPEPMGGTYRKLEKDGKTYMLFPFLGDLGDYFPTRATPRGAKNHLALAVALFKHFSKVDNKILEPLKQLFGPIPSCDYRILPDDKVGRLENAGLQPFLDTVARTLSSYDSKLEDGLLHYDMQKGNFIQTSAGEDRIVDLDLLRAGPAYADILSCALLCGAGEGELRTALVRAEKFGTRTASTFDCAFTVNSGLLWLRSRVQRKEPLNDAVFQRFLEGLLVQQQLYNTL